MTVVIYHKSIFTLLANDVTSWVYKKSRCDFRSSLMKTLDWSVETLGPEIWMHFDWALHLSLQNQSSERNMTDKTEWFNKIW